MTYRIPADRLRLLAAEAAPRDDGRRPALVLSELAALVAMAQEAEMLRELVRELNGRLADALWGENRPSSGKYDDLLRRVLAGEPSG